MAVFKVILISLLFLAVTNAEPIDIIIDILKKAYSGSTLFPGPGSVASMILQNLGSRVSMPSDELINVIQNGIKEQKTYEQMGQDIYQILKKSLNLPNFQEYGRKVDHWYLKRHMDKAVQNGLVQPYVANRLLQTFRPDGRSVNPLTVNEINRIVNEKYDSFLDSYVKNLLLDVRLSSDEKARALAGELQRMNSGQEGYNWVMKKIFN